MRCGVICEMLRAVESLPSSCYSGARPCDDHHAVRAQPSCGMVSGTLPLEALGVDDRLELQYLVER